ncbi:MAG: FAD-binding protein [Saccharofermentanales bacterium]|jgi:electron transfer flavoprotein alpha subunit
MRIVTCVKQVPDERNMETDPVTGSLLRDTAGSIPNPDDVFALAMAHETFEALRDDTRTLDAITMGPRQARSSLRQALSFGFDNAYQLIDSRFAGSDVLATAHTLALAIEKTCGADIVFCGEKSADGDTGQVPAELSVFLGASFLPFVTEILNVDRDRVTVRSMMDDYEYVIESSLPAVIQVKADAMRSVPVVSFRQRMEAQRKPITVLSAEDLSPEDIFGYRNSPTRVRKMVAPDRTRVTILFRGEEAISEFRQILEDNETRAGENKAESSHRQKVVPQHPAQKIDHVESPADPVVIYLEADSDGFQNGLELISRLQACGASTICAVTVLPTQSMSKEETAETRLRDVVGEDLFDKMLQNVAPLSVIETDTPVPTIEECAFLLTQYLRERPAGLCLLSATDHGRSVGPLVAASLRTGITADVTDLRYVNGQWEQVRPAYGGQVFATIVTPERRPVMATVRPRIFSVDLRDDGRGEVLIERMNVPFTRKSRVLSKEERERETTISESKRLLIIGGAITVEDERDKLIAFAKENDMEWGVTRALVQGYLAPHERQIGVSGLTVAPDLVILVGASGSVQTMSGLRRAKKVVAINSDEDAPVFDNVDIALVGSWQEFVDNTCHGDF